MRHEFAALRRACETRQVRVYRDGFGYVFAGHTSVVKPGIKALGGVWNGTLWEVPPAAAREPVAAGELAVLEVITARAARER